MMLIFGDNANDNSDSGYENIIVIMMRMKNGDGGKRIDEDDGDNN